MGEAEHEHVRLAPVQDAGRDAGGQGHGQQQRVGDMEGGKQRGRAESRCPWARKNLKEPLVEEADQSVLLSGRPREHPGQVLDGILHRWKVPRADTAPSARGTSNATPTTSAALRNARPPVVEPDPDLPCGLPPTQVAEDADTEVEGDHELGVAGERACHTQM